MNNEELLNRENAPTQRPVNGIEYINSQGGMIKWVSPNVALPTPINAGLSRLVMVYCEELQSQTTLHYHAPNDKWILPYGNRPIDDTVLFWQDLPEAPNGYDNNV